MNSESYSRNTDLFGKFSAWCSLYTFYVLPVVFFTALLFHFDLAPLEETHWDAPIYVELAKRAAETPMLTEYHQHAEDIQLGPGGAHWHFTRIGHVLLLGEVAQLFGTTETALVAMQWLYRVFMALGVVLCVVLGLRLAALFRPDSKPDSIWWVGYLIAAMTYVASDSYRGLQGHLLSEPPAFLALALFAVTLLRAIERRSLTIGAFAGVLLFLLFFIRIDAILPGIVFPIILLAAFIVSRKFDALPSIVVAGLVSIVFYSIYAWWFSPLVNPQSLADFSSAAKEMFPGVPAKSLSAVVIAGGLLWIGACAVVPMWRDPVVRFSVAWLGLALLPMVVDILSGRSIQVRMAFFVALPLLVLAGEGWGWLLRGFIKQRRILPLGTALGLVILLMLVPYSPVMQASRNLAINHLPSETHKYLFFSLSRNTVIKPDPQHRDSRPGLLVRPMSERWTLDYSKAREIGDFLYASERLVYLLWPRDNLPGQHSLQSYIGLFRYFGKKYPENADIVLTELSSKTDTRPCTARVPTELEPVVFCSNFLSSDLDTLRREEIPLYILGVDGYPMPSNTSQLELKVLLSTPPFVLYEVAK